MTVENVDYESVPQNEKNEDPTPKPPKPPKGWGVRHTQAVLLFISLSVGFSMRAQLSVSLVAMTSNSTLEMWYPNLPRVCKLHKRNATEETDVIHENITQNASVMDESCKVLEDDAKSWTVYRVYNWNKPTEEMILFAFFVGYTGMMIPMGLVAQKYGGKITILIALGANGFLSIMTPWVPIASGWVGVCIIRLLQGMAQAGFYPSVHTMLGKWAPLAERGRLSNYIYTGSQFGTVVAFQVAGLFAGSPSLGWPFTFWFCGVMSFACFIPLAMFGAATPHDHPSISDEELTYIVGEGNTGFKPIQRRTPWKHILTSWSIWGIVASHAGSTSGYLFILTQIPLYMNKILGVDIKKNGVYSSLPYVFMYITSILFGYIGDFCINRGYMSVVNIRRVFNSIGMVVASFFLIGFCYANSTAMAVTLLVLCLAAHSGIHTGFQVNSIDLAPNFAGPIMSLGNMVGNLSGLAVPVLVSKIVGEDVTNHSKWQILFLIVAAIQTLTNTVFVIFAKGTVQPWNFHDEEKSDLKKHSSSFKKIGPDAITRSS